MVAGGSQLGSALGEAGVPVWLIILAVVLLAVIVLMAKFGGFQWLSRKLTRTKGS